MVESDPSTSRNNTLNLKHLYNYHEYLKKKSVDWQWHAFYSVPLDWRSVFNTLKDMREEWGVGSNMGDVVWNQKSTGTTDISRDLW